MMSAGMSAAAVAAAAAAAAAGMPPNGGLTCNGLLDDGSGHALGTSAAMAAGMQLSAADMYQHQQPVS